MDPGFNTASAIKDIINNPGKRITILTGAGISAESGIPTFRGPEGYWTVGSKVYMPQEMATLQMFQQDPTTVWEWYLYRLGVCIHAAPNPGHDALVVLENYLRVRFTLITQNIDNLHIRAGNTLARTYQIHGNINYTRCAADCSNALLPLPDALKRKRDTKTLSSDESSLLHCEACGNWLRPHVLWFDEYYDEEHFRFDSSMATAQQTDLLIIVGTSASTNLPNQVAAMVYNRGGTIIDVNVEENPFSELADNSPDGQFIKQAAAVFLPEFVHFCTS